MYVWIYVWLCTDGCIPKAMYVWLCVTGLKGKGRGKHKWDEDQPRGRIGGRGRMSGRGRLSGRGGG